MSAQTTATALAVAVATGASATVAAVTALRATPAASLGGVDSLVIEPRYSSHEHMTPDEREKIGIPDGFLRMSIGIENAEDLIADIEQALQQ